jgi:hypothetical protein
MFRVAPKTLYDYEVEEWSVPPHLPKRARTFYSPSGDSLAALYFSFRNRQAFAAASLLLAILKGMVGTKAKKPSFLALDS